MAPGERAGFFLGDGAGVGKGRQIAGLIKEFWATGGRRVLWVSTSSDLRYDARRDLHDVHGKGSHHWIHVHPKVRWWSIRSTGQMEGARGRGGLGSGSRKDWPQGKREGDEGEPGYGSGGGEGGMRAEAEGIGEPPLE